MIATFTSVLCLRSAAFVTGMVLALPTISAAADTDASAPTPGISEIIVTSRKIEENLQNVPIAITALTGADLNAAGVKDLRDITFLTPGLTFTEGGGSNYFSKPIIRGQTDIGGSSDNNVPVFLDGVYISNSSALDLGLVDLARVEVVKGPVSALYGRSAYAGAINYISARPTSQYQGYAELTVGDYNRINERVGFSGPIIGDVLKGGISGSLDRFNGTYHDSVTGQNANGYYKKDVLANFDFTPNDNLEIRPVVYFGDDNFAAEAVTFGPANCGALGPFSFAQSYCGRAPGANFQGPYNSAPGQYGQTGNSRRVFLTSLDASAKYDWGSIASLTGYDSIKSNQYNEFDLTRFGFPTPTYVLPPGAAVGGFPPADEVPVPTGTTALTPLHFGYTNDNNDLSEELRFTSPQGQPLRYTAGAYFAYTRIYQDLNLAQGTCAVPAGQYILSSFATPCGVQYSGQQTAFEETNKIYAGFVGFDWDIIKQLTLSAEVRDQANKATYQDQYAIFTPFPTSGYSTSTPSSPNPIGPGVLATTFHDVTSRESLNYHATDDVLAYVSAANGAKVGGFNNSTAFPTYQPETNWTYEAGIKSTFFDKRAQINADVFYINAKNYQILGPPPGSTLPGGFVTTNYGGLSTKGFEFEALVTPIQGVKFSAGVGYADPKFKSTAYDFGDVALCAAIPSCAGRVVTVGPNQAVRLDGLRPPFESNFTGNAAIDVHFPVYQAWALVARVDERYESKQYYQYPIDTGYFGPRNIVNLRAGVDSGTFSLVFWVKNLSNDKTPETVQDAFVTGNSTSFTGQGYFPEAVLPDGRTYGATFRYNFKP